MYQDDPRSGRAEARAGRLHEFGSLRPFVVNDKQAGFDANRTPTEGAHWLVVHSPPSSLAPPPVTYRHSTNQRSALLQMSACTSLPMDSSSGSRGATPQNMADSTWKEGNNNQEATSDTTRQVLREGARCLGSLIKTVHVRQKVLRQANALGTSNAPSGHRPNNQSMRNPQQ